MAQAFSTRVARLKRRSGDACNTSEAVKSCAEKPGIEMAEHDLVDIARRDAGVGQRIGGRA